MIGLVKKLKAYVARKIYPYWCPFCQARFRKKSDFATHYMEERPQALKDIEAKYGNRQYRRTKAKIIKAKRKLGRK